VARLLTFCIRIVAQVMPKDYHQIVLYLEGKRALDQIYHG
jgi:hypothetical protein